ncbi:hypothetical protein DKM44_12990 [Deinococcus irradiatisoli]|uniref:Uncharacterized protein n=2 Tax=Deinococcus irradiatisoli TaxID=2202254 RepID=A0A2Z3JFS2_9DEIO|nr:hypothetical protein DKM44_12990 [Deinococcus irradiatisoli]
MQYPLQVRPSMPAAESRAQVHARLLRDWMADKGLKAPSLALSVEKQGQQISPDYIRKLVRGERELSGMPLELREAVRRALRVPAEEWEEATGLATAVDIDPDPSPTLPIPTRRTWELPDALQQMIDERKHLDPSLLEERWQQYMARQKFSSGEATADRYWNLFLLLKNAGVEPGGN